MTKKYCDSPIHKVSSLALAFIILAFCVLPSFVHADSVRPNEPVGWKDGDTFRDILLVVLDSWGISFSKSDSSDTTSILEYSDQLLQEFYHDNSTTQELFWDLVKYGVDQTGNIILDFLGVNKIRQFANWLKDKFSLTDNSSTPTQSSSSLNINGYPCYSVPTNFSPFHDFNSSSRPAYVFYQVYNEAGTQYQSVIFSPGSDNFTFKRKNISSTYTANLHTPNNQYTYFYFHSSIPNSNPGGVLLIPYGPSIAEILEGPVVSSPSINLVITTTTLDIPSEEMDPDDGLQIEIPGTNWGDSIYSILDLIERLIGLYDNTQLEIISVVETLENLLENLQHSVTVENIPGAVILDYDDYDIPLENEWGLFDIFFNTGGDEISLLRPWQELRAIIYGFPAPILSFFALVVLFIVAYGFIRMGRDSH